MDKIWDGNWEVIDGPWPLWRT